MLAVWQTILLRLHNKITQEFTRLNPTWDDEMLFQESRRLVIAMIQHIMFKHFLPNLLGMMKKTNVKLLILIGRLTPLLL